RKSMRFLLARQACRCRAFAVSPGEADEPTSRAALAAAPGSMTRGIGLIATTTDVYPGKDLGTLELTVPAEMVQHYIKGLDEPNPWYTAASPFGGPVGPAVGFHAGDSGFK